MMIYAKLDYYTVMLKERSIKYILDKLHIDVTAYEEFFSNYVKSSLGGIDTMRFSFSCVSVEFYQSDYELVKAKYLRIFDTGEFVYSDEFLDWVFPKIRVDISGTGLDFLRGRFDVDSSLIDINFWGEKNLYNVTRADFAFDFVNYQPEFVDNLLAYTFNEFSSHNFRLSTGRKGGIKYSFKAGDQNTIYLGSKDRQLLRVYDKRMQYMRDGVQIKQYPSQFLLDHSSVESWFRLELQVRRDIAEYHLFGITNLTDILRSVFDNFMLFDRDTKVPVDFMQQLFDWGSLPPIIQNAKYETFVTEKQRVDRFVEGTGFQLIIEYIAMYGISGMLHRFSEKLYQMSVRDDHVSKRRYSSLGLRLANLKEQDGYKDYELKVYQDNGIYKIDTKS